MLAVSSSEISRGGGRSFLAPRCLTVCVVWCKRTPHRGRSAAADRSATHSMEQRSADPVASDCDEIPVCCILHLLPLVPRPQLLHCKKAASSRARTCKTSSQYLESRRKRWRRALIPGGAAGPEVKKAYSTLGYDGSETFTTTLYLQTGPDDPLYLQTGLCMVPAADTPVRQTLRTARRRVTLPITARNVERERERCF